MTPEDLIVAGVAIDTVSERACVCDGASKVETETLSPVNLQEVLDEVSAIDVGLGPPRPMNRKLGLSEPRVRPPALGHFIALAVLGRREDSTYLGPRGAADDARPQGRLTPNLPEVLGQEKAAQRKAYAQTHTTGNKRGARFGLHEQVE